MENPCADRVHSGYYPCAVVWWDNGREKDGDYVTLASMSYKTLKLEFRNGCAPYFRAIITEQAKQYQPGKPLQIAGNMTIILGE